MTNVWFVLVRNEQKDVDAVVHSRFLGCASVFARCVSCVAHVRRAMQCVAYARIHLQQRS